MGREKFQIFRALQQMRLGLPCASKQCNMVMSSKPSFVGPKILMRGTSALQQVQEWGWT